MASAGPILDSASAGATMTRGSPHTVTHSRIPTIRRLDESDLAAAADVIRRSFATVAEEFGLTRENSPGHTSFMTVDRLTTLFAQGWRMYGLEDDDRLVGYVALAAGADGVDEMHYLGVVPDSRHRQFGRRLMDFCKGEAVERGARGISLSMMEQNTTLKDWYIVHGFAPTGTARFPRLAFTVEYMLWRPGESAPGPGAG